MSTSTDNLNALRSIPCIELRFPTTPLTSAALVYVREHCDEVCVNHVIRSAYWALILAKKIPRFANLTDADLETVVLSTLLHDMGWSKDESFLDMTKRFEVDGADIARNWMHNHTDWSEPRLQSLWYAIALHTSFSIAPHAEPVAALTSLGIGADFHGPYLALPGIDGPLITLNEFRAVRSVAPPVGWNAEGIKDVLCYICKTKPATTFDNFVGAYGRTYGIDAKGAGKEEFAKAMDEATDRASLTMALDRLEDLEKSI
jgi:hypothetical protein